MAKRKTPPPTDAMAIVKRMKEMGIHQCIVSVSCGKDSAALLDVCVRHFGRENVYPFFMYLIKGLSFQEKYLTYMERLHDITIDRIQDWHLSVYMRLGEFRMPTLADKDVPKVTINDVYAEIRRRSQMEWIATGEKAIDSVERNAQIRSQNGVSTKRRVFWPLAFWNHAAVFNYCKERRIALSSDYNNPESSSSFGNFAARQLYWVYTNYPEDFKKLTKLFPLLPAQIMRYELQQARESKENVESETNSSV